MSLSVCVCALHACGLPIDDLIDSVAQHARESGEQCAARPTTHISIRLTLDPAVSTPQLWDEANPGATAEFSHGLTIFTADGQQQELSFYYSFVGHDVWQWHAVGVDNPVSLGSGELEFDDMGGLIRSTVTEPLPAPGAGPTAGAIVVDYGPLATDGSVNTTGAVTSVSDVSSFVSLEVDGRSACSQSMT